MPTSCCTFGFVELAYLILLVAAFVAIGVMSVFILVKLYAGQR